VLKLNDQKIEEIHQVVIGLGSNIDPSENLKSSIYLLGRLVPIVAISGVWLTRAVGSPGPDFLNAAALITTPLSADELRSNILRPIENLLGRIRAKDPNAPRTIDLDILIFDDKLLDDELWNYAHMAVPVAEILPAFVDPDSGEKATTIAERLHESGHISRYPLKLHLTSPTRDIV
jgi:2-amino-4-hydroxy-6-hydroxymethyldihydropteridine diphosphokinase